MARERFSYTGDSGVRRFSINTGIISAIIWIAIIWGFLYGLNYFGDYTTLKQKESLENAIRRGIAQCYAIEGIYPPGIAYLEEHYGLSYDPDDFYVDYTPVGSNLYPDVTVIVRNAR